MTTPMPRLGIVSALMLASACSVAQVSPQSAGSGWLNARDCGASGSEFETSAVTEAGSKKIVVKDVGDFRVGHGVMVTKCNPHYTLDTIWGPHGQVAWGRKIKGEAEIRGYTGDQGDWVVLVLDVGLGGKAFRWTEDLARTWHPTVPITGDWQPIRDGIEVRFNEFEWDKGYTVAFSARGQLVSVITAIEGNTVTLREAPTRTAKDAVLRHCDDAALQAGIDRALKEKRNLYVPCGHYRLSRGLVVRNPQGITIEGENAVHTVLDISEGNDACVTLAGGADVTLRNFTMVGHSGFDRADQCGHIPMQGSTYFWGFAAKNCNATTISSTERVLIENCHGRRMASECFVSGSRGRGTPDKPITAHTKQTTYLRCSAIDCARNGFNDVMCGSENTSVLYCRIENAGGCSWEGAGRFVRFIGNYVRNSGPIAMGNLGTANRDPSFDFVGAGQHIIADNVFEGGTSYGGRSGMNMICTSVGSTQVIVRNNLFINFNSSGVTASGRSDPTHYASANTIISGNIFDMTCVEKTSLARFAIDVSASDAIVSDNQIYVRGAPDANVTAVKIAEPAVNVSVHDNLIRNCGAGIVTSRLSAKVGEAVDGVTFTTSSASLPLDQRRERQCEGWRLVWLAKGRPSGVSVLDAIIGAAKPETVQFKLKEPREMKAGDAFEAIPVATNWSIHNNTITGCIRPVALDAYGGSSSIFRDNTVSRGDAQGVKRAVSVAGQFVFVGNTFSGFDEPDSLALWLAPDPLGKCDLNVFQRNTFERCATVVKEASEGLWKGCITDTNLFVNCPAAPATGGTVITRAQAEPVFLPPPPPPTLAAPKLAAPVTVDGTVAEWPWRDNTRAVTLAQTPAGDPMPTPLGFACAARDDANFYLAIRLVLPKDVKPVGGGNWGVGDGVEVSFQDGGPKATAPIFLVWGDATGRFESGPYGGATPQQVDALQKAVTYAVRAGEGEWTCEWRIPFVAAGLDPAATSELRFNIGVHQAASDVWGAWVGTGGVLYQVGSAGKLVFGK